MIIVTAKISTIAQNIKNVDKIFIRTCNFYEAHALKGCEKVIVQI